MRHFAVGPAIGDVEVLFVAPKHFQSRARYSFFFEGLTGLTITIGAIVTLALLMAATAKLNWADRFASKPTLRGFPPPVPNV